MAHGEADRPLESIGGAAVEVTIEGLVTFDRTTNDILLEMCGELKAIRVLLEYLTEIEVKELSHED